MTESIIGGTVKYSNDGAVGSEVTYYCEDGFKPYPILKKICNSKRKWEPEISRVLCEGQIAIDGTKIITILLFTFTFFFVKFSLKKTTSYMQWWAVLEELDYGDIEEPQKNCSVAEIINGGSVSYSNDGLEGSVMTYHCNFGYYPYPVSKRVCNSRGEWSVMILPNGKTVSTATCKGKPLNMSYSLRP